jgi:hypothetical protein
MKENTIDYIVQELGPGANICIKENGGVMIFTLQEKWGPTQDNMYVLAGSDQWRKYCLGLQTLAI